MKLDLVQNIAVFLAVMLIAGAIYFVSHVTIAKMGLMRGVGKATVVLGVLSALAAALLSFFSLGSWYSDGPVHALSSVAAPIAFLGYLGIYVLCGPVTVDRSITLAILQSLYASGQRGMSLEELRSSVPFGRILDKRLKELTDKRIVLRGERLQLTVRGKRVLHSYVWLGHALNVEFQ